MLIHALSVAGKLQSFRRVNSYWKDRGTLTGADHDEDEEAKHHRADSEAILVLLQ